MINKLDIIKKYLLSEAEKRFNKVLEEGFKENDYDIIEWCLGIFLALLPWESFLEKTSRVPVSTLRVYVNKMICSELLENLSEEERIRKMVELYSVVPSDDSIDWVAIFIKSRFNELVADIDPEDPPDWFFLVMESDTDIKDSDTFRDVALQVYYFLRNQENSEK